MIPTVVENGSGAKSLKTMWIAGENDNVHVQTRRAERNGTRRKRRRRRRIGTERKERPKTKKREIRMVIMKKGKKSVLVFSQR